MPNDTDYAAMYPEIHAEWVAAGGTPQESFEMYLRGTGRIPSNKLDILRMIQKQEDHLKELWNVVEDAPFE